jgi:Acyl-CoA reductase (LuxC)
MIVRTRVPAQGEQPLAPLLNRLTDGHRGEPFADDAVELCNRFAQRLMSDPVARVHPELMTLAVFMRKTELTRMKREFEASGRPDVVRVPHGLVFHLPPAHVDTLFMYSWLWSVLAGNSNLVRLSSRSSPVIDHLCDLLAAELDRPEMAGPRSRLAMIQYDHDPAITAAISARSMLRVIWGSDATIATIRREAPLPAFGRDLTFADRWSLLALGAEAVASLHDTGIDQLAERVFNDVFWFDQLACSSPRLCLWIGDRTQVTAARRRLWPAVAEVATRRGYRPEVGARLGRELFIHRAVLDGPVIARSDFGPALAVLRIDRLDGLRRDHPGMGLMFEAVAPSLASIDRYVDRKDQTLSHFGLSRQDLLGLAERLGGRGIDRIVPVGQALHLARYWDGYDLGAEFVRSVHVVVG